MKANTKTTNGSILRNGAIKSTKQLGILRRWPDLGGNRPMLFADIADEMELPSTRIQTHIHAEVIEGSEQQLYLFRLQIGAKLICWLANPYDPEVHSMLHQWATAGHMFCAVETSNGTRVLTRPVIGEVADREAGAMAAAQEDWARFIRSATDAVSSGLVKAQATSKIDSIKTIRKVLIFSVPRQADSVVKCCS